MENVENLGNVGEQLSLMDFCRGAVAYVSCNLANVTLDTCICSPPSTPSASHLHHYHPKSDCAVQENSSNAIANGNGNGNGNEYKNLGNKFLAEKPPPPQNSALCWQFQVLLGSSIKNSIKSETHYVGKAT